MSTPGLSCGQQEQGLGSPEHENLLLARESLSSYPACPLTWCGAPCNPRCLAVPHTEPGEEVEESHLSYSPGFPGSVEGVVVGVGEELQMWGWKWHGGASPSQTLRRHSPPEAVGRPAGLTQIFGGRSSLECLGPQEACLGRKCCLNLEDSVVFCSASGLRPRGRAIPQGGCSL